MGALDTALRGAAKAALVAVGGTATLATLSQGAYNPATRSSTNTSTDTTVKGVWGQYSIAETGGQIQAGDARFYIYAEGITAPTNKDTLTLGSVVYQIISVNPIMASDQAAMYELQLRGKD